MIIIKEEIILITHAFTKKVLNRTVLFILRGNSGINNQEKSERKTGFKKTKKEREQTINKKLKIERSQLEHLHSFTKKFILNVAFNEIN